jgi:hypothetical protein
MDEASFAAQREQAPSPQGVRRSACASANKCRPNAITHCHHENIHVIFHEI